MNLAQSVARTDEDPPSADAEGSSTRPPEVVQQRLPKRTAQPSAKRILVAPGLSYFELLPGPGIAPFWSGVAAILGFAPKTPIADGPVSVTMMRHTRLRKAALQIVPWGVITAVAHGWDEITQLVHESIEQAPGTNDRGWPNAKSFIYVDIAAERFQSVCDYHPALADLPMLSRAFAAETERQLAIDMEGADQAGTNNTGADRAGADRAGERGVDPRSGDAFARILMGARAIARSELGKDLFDVTTADYRTMSRRLRTEGLERLRTMLLERSERLDRAPLAAVLAAELGAEDLIDDLIPLRNSPCPIAAAICRAAAIRLGASPSRFGSYRELRAFLEESEAQRLEGWASGGLAP